MGNDSKIGVLIITLFSLFFTACTSNYTIKEFNSKKEYYNYFNDHSGNKKLNIKLTIDSSLITDSGARIQSDSLLFKYDIVKSGNEVIPLSEINSIDYKTSDNRSAHLSLKNGREIEAENLMFQPNSLKCKIKENLARNEKIPLSLIKAISYKNHFQGIVTGILCGFLAGVILTASQVIPAEVHEGNPPYPHDYNFMAVGLISLPLGIIAGGVIGGNIGYKYTYHFNQ